ncbi:endopeptidase La [Clostridium botulinum]|uniref:Lon protease n=2 Tax=Clostridium botulinum TaxID=1491 RepID=A0A4Q1HD76_CLOBO|nr:endopeptidase La [Clostridium botulinum]EKX80778.1 ATP-dependent protease La [Clostridium botulinum CFSAN001628]KRU27866.1 ATP-dependent protease La [Clostridium sporogenes]ACA44629.1 ATP-dependent protease La [Clostridium botulinum B1 str. Okra]ACA55944.1 ATP-dependent protease La [Clostridium botulinum A3 str. Loch Maree]KRU30037.1 ATP-dependent protease La [Clostridium sporogenes]
MKENLEVLPLIPLRGIIIFPYMILHFDVGREKSILALEEAMENEQKIFLSAQKEAETEEPIVEDIYDIGTICEIKQILKLPGDTVRVLVEGKTRGRIVNYLEEEPFLKVEIEEIEDNQYEDDKEVDALIRLVKTNFDEYIKLSGDSSSDLTVGVEDLEEPGRIADVIGSYININQEEKQELIGIIDSKERLERILIIINEEIEILKIERKIGIKVKNKIDKVQKEYYLKEQLKAIQEELGEDEEDKKEINLYKEKINKAKLPKEVKEKAIYELDRLKNSGNFSAEGGVIRTYLDWILSLPWNKDTKDNLDIKKAREILDKEHYGLKDVKDRIIEYLAVRKVSKTLKGPILCLVGPPGVGKTSIAKSIAHSLNRNFVRMSLGGVRDEAEIRGHRKTYVGAIPGRVIYGMKQAKSKNPLFLLDEIDKMSNDFRGDPADALLEVLDAEQNATFRDHYLELDFDLSKVLFITTANTLSTIPGPLLDRMEVIEVSGYTSEEKFYIAKNHLIPKKLKEHNMEDGKITFSNSSIYYIIDNYTRESGVRGLERKISSIIRKSITEMIEKNKDTTNVTINHVKKYLGPEVFSYEKADKEDKIGVVTGLAWTAYGGDTLPIEVTAMDGNGKLQLTGKLGEVMVESAKAGYSYVRSNASKYEIDTDFYKNKDIHIHVPEGAVPKDGPSAGVTMITALISALGGKRVKHNVAMTGEITLTGRVLPIGGLKEKSLAAYRAGIDTIIIPKANEKDLRNIPKTVKNKIDFIVADRIEKVLDNALIKEQ